MGPKKKKEKKSKKEREEAARLAREAEEERLRIEQEEKARLEKERKEAQAKAKREKEEQNVRDDKLASTCQLFEELMNNKLEFDQKKRSEEEWERYVSSKRLPMPENPQDMNTRLYEWKLEEGDIDFARTMDKIKDSAELLNVLDNIIDNPLAATAEMVENWKEVRSNYRSEIELSLDLSTFRLLRHIEEELNKIDLFTLDFHEENDFLTFSMWGPMIIPVSVADKRPPPTVHFPNMGLVINLPPPYDKKLVMVRAIHYKFDLYSDSSKSFSPPIVDPSLLRNLYTEMELWYDEKIYLGQEVDNLRNEKEEREAKKSGSARQSEKRSLLEGEKSRPSTPIVSKENKQSKLGHVSTHFEDQNQLEFEVSQTMEDVMMDKKVVFAEGLEEEETFTDECEPVGRYYLKDEDAIKLLVFYEPEDPNEPDWKPPATSGEDSEPEDPEKLMKIKPRPFKPLWKLILEYKSPEEVKRESSPGDVAVKKTKKKIVEEEVPIPIKTAAQIMAEQELARYEAFQNAMKIHDLGSEELNLRKYVILGGIYVVELLLHEHQEYRLADRAVVQLTNGISNVHKENFYFVYTPPVITESENGDEEDKPPPDDDIDKLILLTLNLPDTVAWFETPMPVQWDREQRIWKNTNVYDARYNEEKFQLTFRIGTTNPIGIAAFKYVNLPFQAWEIRPEWKKPGNVFFSLTAAIVIAEFHIQDNLVCLNQLQNAPNSALESVEGQYFEPEVLITKMKRAGVDLFPDQDSFLYIEGANPKDWVIENHLYHCMAIYGLVMNFAWSRWNAQVPKDQIVFQMREALSKKRLESYQVIYADKERSKTVNCTEISPFFSAESIPDQGYYPDLFSLLDENTSDKLKERLDVTDIHPAETVYKLLKRTRFFSFS